MPAGQQLLSPILHACGRPGAAAGPPSTVLYQRWVRQRQARAHLQAGAVAVGNAITLTVAVAVGTLAAGAEGREAV